MFCFGVFCLTTEATNKGCKQKPYVGLHWNTNWHLKNEKTKELVDENEHTSHNPEMVATYLHMIVFREAALWFLDKSAAVINIFQLVWRFIFTLIEACGKRCYPVWKRVKLLIAKQHKGQTQQLD